MYDESTKEIGGRKMRDLVFKELRDCNRFICNGLNEAQKEEGYNLLIATVKKMLELCYIARKEGLLALEIDIDKCKTVILFRWLKPLIYNHYYSFLIMFYILQFFLWNFEQ